MENNQLQLVTFEQTKRLKELGFNWRVYSCYAKSGDIYPYAPDAPYDFNSRPELDVLISAPTVQLALKWLRENEEHHIVGTVEYDEFSDGYSYKIVRIFDISKYSDNEYATYEAAESALLDELLTFIENQKS